MSDPALDLIRSDEGLRLAAYDDRTGRRVSATGECVGTLTIGYGHTGTDVSPGLTITRARADELLARDYATALREARTCVGAVWWESLDDVRQAAVANMAFELGGRGLAGFEHMLAAIRARDWAVAAREALESMWARQVPDRAQRIAGMIETGQWPTNTGPGT